jgi:hypothetical protein
MSSPDCEDYPTHNGCQLSTLNFAKGLSCRTNPFSRSIVTDSSQKQSHCKPLQTHIDPFYPIEFGFCQPFDTATVAVSKGQVSLLMKQTDALAVDPCDRSGIDIRLAVVVDFTR